MLKDNVIPLEPTPSDNWLHSPIMHQPSAKTSTEFKEINLGEFLKQVKNGSPTVTRYRELFSAFTLDTAELVKTKKRLAKEVVGVGETYGKGSNEYEAKKAEFDSVCAEYKAKKDPVDAFKKGLSAVTVAGTFKGRRAKVDFVKSSGIFLIDIDKIDDPKAAKKLLIKTIPSLAFTFISPSENGLKAGFRVNPFKDDSEFKALFNLLQPWFADVHGIEIDETCKDVSRLCFVSHDPDIYVNKTPEILEFNQVDIVGEIIDTATGELVNYTPSPAASEYPDAYVIKVINSELEALGNVVEGERNHQLNKSAFNLFSLLYASGRNDLEGDVRERLQASAEAIGLGAAEIKTTIASAFNARAENTRKPPALAFNSNSLTTCKLSELNKNYSLVIIGGVAKVMQHNSENVYDTMGVEAFRILYGNEFILAGTAEEPKYKPLGREWVAWRDRLTYKEGVCFEPYSIVLPKFINPHKLNMWTGFPYTQIKHDERIEVITEYILETVCDNNAEYFDYLIKWMARGFQQPEKQAEVAVVLRGSKGSGKGTLGKLIKKMWGAHGKQITSTGHLTGKFNAHLKNCGFLFADEAFFAGDKAGEAALQTLITEPTMMVEFKGVDAFEVKNCLKILMASNKDWVVPSSKDERRYFCLDIEEIERDYGYFQTKTEYFDQLYKAINDKTTMSMFMDYMLTLDLTDFDIRTYPETAANKQQRIASLDIIPRFLLEACERGYITTGGFESGWHQKVTAEVIAKGLAEWGKDNFKSSYDRQSLVSIKAYLSKSLRIISRAHRGVAYTNQGNVVLHPKIKGGYDLGTADALKDHIIRVEKLPEDITLEG